MAHKPRNVMHMKTLERIVCCYIRCENVKLKVQALNQAVVRMQVNDLRVKKPDDLSAKTMCPPINGQLSLKCIQRKCTHCSVDAIRKHYLPLMQKDHNRVTVHKFDQWQNVSVEVIGKDLEGNHVKKQVKRLKRVTHNVDNVSQIVQLLMSDMEEYSAHKFRADWQKSQFEHLKANMPPKSTVIVVDFAMNYTCFLQDEVQSYHWAPPQVTIHPCYSYVNSSSEVSPPTNTEAIIFISPDTQHDAAAVATFLKICSKKLKEEYDITKWFQFSDCCAGQYRSATSFADLSFSLKDTGLETERHYFESSHGKSPADGQGAIVKSSATMAMTRRETQIRSAREFFEFCERKLTDVGQGIFPSRNQSYLHAHRRFVFVDTEDIERNRPERKVKTVSGTRNLHCIKSLGTPYHIKTRKLSCFCDLRISNLPNKGCNNSSIVDAWADVHLQRIKSILFFFKLVKVLRLK